MTLKLRGEGGGEEGEGRGDNLFNVVLLRMV